MDRLPTKKIHFKSVARLNYEHLEDLISIDDGDSQVINDLIHIFEKIYHEKWLQIKMSARKMHLNALAREMHSFKVSCHNVGALRASVIAKEIHRLSCQADTSTETLNQLITDLEIEIAEALAEIRDFINQGSSNAA
ncbi:hypothetical protein [Bdellovibrio sp. HCB337]|uniref:hypothetical protein n=1 Tax=Bdellovibrio sp. HCB337 TaxID=3394358 RepID=UPI0039A5435C